MSKCKVCGKKSDIVFNISFKAVTICENCASSIFLQQAKYYTEINHQKNNNIDLSK